MIKKAEEVIKNAVITIKQSIPATSNSRILGSSRSKPRTKVYINGHESNSYFYIFKSTYNKIVTA